jgi:hypothetical protein
MNPPVNKCQPPVGADQEDIEKSKALVFAEPVMAVTPVGSQDAQTPPAAAEFEAEPKRSGSESADYKSHKDWVMSIITLHNLN